MDVIRQPRQLVTISLLIVVFIAGFALGQQRTPTSAQGQFTQPADSRGDFEAFWQTYFLIRSQFVSPDGESLDNTALVDGAIRGMVMALQDQNSGYLNATEYPMTFDNISGTIEGIGVIIRTRETDNAIEIVNVLEGTPAAAADIRIGDIFAAVEGESVLDLTQVELAARVRGPAGSKINVTMLRDGEYIDFDMTRERISVPNIEYEVLPDTSIGYIRLLQFTNNARDEIDTALEQLEAGTLTGIIFDFRSNPGGLLTSAIEVASAFIPEGTILIEDFGENEQVFTADGTYNPLLAEKPIVILVDERSASASELVAGALQDHNLATIIGTKTFGKGTVQTIQELVNGGGLRLTVARWLTPDRHWIHGEGITPDIVVEWDPFADPQSEEDPQLDAAVEYLSASTKTP